MIMAKRAHSKFLVLPVVLSLLLSLGMDRRTKQGYSILRAIAIRAYDGDAIALRRLVYSCKSTNDYVARHTPWLLRMSLNPGNLSILAEIFDETQDEDIRIAIVKSLTDFATEPEARSILSAAEEIGGEMGTLAEELLAKPPVPPRDDAIRERVTHPSTRPRAQAYRDSMFQEFLHAEGVVEKLELARKLSEFGEDRLLPYVDDLMDQIDLDLLNQVDLPDNMRRLWLMKINISPLIRHVSLKKGSELPVAERRRLYEEILSAIFSEKSLLRDLSGEPVKLKIPGVWGMKRDRVVYITDYNLVDIEGLALHGYKVHVESIWNIKGRANKSKHFFDHLGFGKVYTCDGYAVTVVTCYPTSCIRQPGPFLAGGGSEILLKRIDGEWRFHSILSSWIS